MKKEKSQALVSSWFEKLTFSWVHPLMEQGNKQVLEVEDLHQMPSQQDVKTASDVFDTTFQHELELEKINTNNVSGLKGIKILRDFWASPVTKAIVQM